MRDVPDENQKITALGIAARGKGVTIFATASVEMGV